jgi:hypothetical protein
MTHPIAETNIIHILIFEPTSKYEPLHIAVIEIWHRSKSTLEFLNRIEQKIGEFLQYKLTDIELLTDEILVTRVNFNLFHNTLIEVKENLIHFEPELHKGELLSIKNGIKYFLIYDYFYAYREYLNATGYIFRIWENSNHTKDYFSFQLREMENGEDLKVVDLYPDSSKYYLGKGISIAIILKAKQIFNKRIISSSNKHKSHSGEFNTAEAIKNVWEPMVENGLAKYYETGDYYYVE